MRVLIVDDSRIMREHIVEALSELPDVEMVGEVADADEVESAIEELDPDVVTLDIKLKSGNGVDVLRDIKEKHPSVTVIMLTNYPYPQYRRECLRAGADYFFDKSTEFEQVAEACGRLASRTSRGDQGA